ncbi:hypothetical protein QQ045_001628 [Rhodiola kirilowii]
MFDEEQFVEQFVQSPAGYATVSGPNARHDSPIGHVSAHNHRVPATPSRDSVDRPEPRLYPYPDLTPSGNYVRRESSVGTDNDDTTSQNRVHIKALNNEHCSPDDIQIDLGFDCMGKHWEAGWTTISTCSRRAREQWFKEFSMLAKWDENETPIIKRIFNSKCRKKLIESWYNARHRRSLEGPKWLKPHEVRAGIQYYLDHPEDLEKISARNKKNSEGSDGRCVHLGGNKASHVHKARMTTALRKTIYCYDMYVRLKKKPDGTFVEEDGARKAVEISAAGGINVGFRCSP